MIPNIQTKIAAFLKKNHFSPVYAYEPGKSVVKKDFVLSWTYNYSTIVKKGQQKYFLKILLKQEKYRDMERQINFLTLLNRQKNLTFKIPRLHDWGLDKEFAFYLSEYIPGELLGNSVQTKPKFATGSIFEKLQNGLIEIQTVSSKSQRWQPVKTVSWAEKKLEKALAQDDIKKALGKTLTDQIRQLRRKILNTKYLILNTNLWGDPGPNNLLVEDGQIAMIDYAPFTTGYQYADLVEFASFCIFEQKWEAFVKIVKQTIASRSNMNGNDTFNLFFTVFLIDRIGSVLWLEKKNRLKLQLKKSKEYYLETIKSYLVSLL